ncbi:histidine phosphatase family protein [Mycolicibacterium sp. 050232]|uniref:histidine phosphatase family protein n=1 Tax=Mycolicibacterium sp. 050232 TaxID=3113982 RepID=UPI002E291B56|nr:histidine phosphatase family protein [Mycolicibacterium sp. 050232]MED5811566.1 histidine phosphatase family protein [Mycolicibacterium sp. 050232]
MDRHSKFDNGAVPAVRRRSRTTWRGLGIVLTAFGFFVMSVLPAWAAENMRVTFVRHGQSAGNTSGNIDTSTPGPSLTPLGREQAEAVVDKLGDNNYDAIYASQMIRTQQTAEPMSAYLGLPIQVLPGLQEIEAGDYEGTPESGALGGYLKAPIAWAFAGQLDARIPGSIDGNEFDARVDGALKTMYDKGDRNVVVFSHGGTIMFWTMMNAKNLTLAEKGMLLSQHALGNTDYVVIEGNPEDGWTLVDWNGQRFSPEPTFGHEVGLQVRTLTRQLEAAMKQATDSFATGDLIQVATAINRSVADASLSMAKFNRAINAEVIERVGKVIDKVGNPDSDPVSELTDKVSDRANTVAPDTTSATSMLKPLNTVVADPKEAPATAGDDRDSVTRKVTSTVRGNGATDLTTGNMVRPGKAFADAKRTGEQVRTAVSDAADQLRSTVKSSVGSITGAAKKVSESVGAPSVSRDSAGSEKASADSDS